MTTFLVSGTGTEVGKTVVTAAVASLTVGRSRTCTVIKPGQTGVPDGGPGDLSEVVRLAGERVRTVELARYPDPLSPAAAARRSGRATVDLAMVASAVLQAQRDSDLVLVEGAGGLLVHYDDDGFTMADLARALRLPVLLIVSCGLGTLNSTALTLEVMAGRGLELAGLVIGSWPERPTLTDRSNVPDLERLAARPLLGAPAAGIGRCDRSGFAEAARAGIAPALGGSFDATAFRRAAAA